MSNKLLLGLLLTILVFITVVLATAKIYAEERMKQEGASQELVSPPAPPAVPEVPAPPVVE